MESIIIWPKTRIAYRRIDGDRHKPVLLFLHEGLGCTEMWREFPQALCRDTGCPGIIYDRQGYGHSAPLSAPRTVHYLHAYAHEELPRVIEALLPQQAFVIIGHSDGGSIGLLYAAERPGQIKGLVTMASHVYVDETTLNGITSAVAAYAAGKLDALSRYHGAQTDAMFRAWADTWLAAWFRTWRIDYALPAIQCPVLAIQGKQDQYGEADQVTAIVQGVGHHARGQMIDNCGHAPHIDRPHRIRQLMRSFLYSIPGFG